MSGGLAWRRPPAPSGINLRAPAGSNTRWYGSCWAASRATISALRCRQLYHGRQAPSRELLVARTSAGSSSASIHSSRPKSGRRHTHKAPGRFQLLRARTRGCGLVATCRKRHCCSRIRNRFLGVKPRVQVYNSAVRLLVSPHPRPRTTSSVTSERPDWLGVPRALFRPIQRLRVFDHGRSPKPRW